MAISSPRIRRLVRQAIPGQATSGQAAAATTLEGLGPRPDSAPPRFVRWLGPTVVACLLLGHVAVSGGMRYPTQPAEGRSLMGPAPAPAARPVLRLATFNIQAGRSAGGRTDLDRTAEALRGLNVDLVALNEVRGALPWDEANQAQALGLALDLPWLFAPTEERWWHEHFGNALLCRLPVTRWRRTPLPGTQHRGFRNMLVSEVQLAGRTVHILSTHIDRRQDHDLQLQMVIDWFLALPEPAVLLGDLNTTRQDPQLRRLLQFPGVRDPLWDSQAEPSGKRFDWIVTRRLRTLAAGVADSGASDHPAYWAELEVER
jgi:endonuclease/exonuclease/phosphatase family metal-dependent hydrolase